MYFPLFLSQTLVVSSLLSSTVLAAPFARHWSISSHTNPNNTLPPFMPIRRRSEITTFNAELTAFEVYILNFITLGATDATSVSTLKSHVDTMVASVNTYTAAYPTDIGFQLKLTVNAFASYIDNWMYQIPYYHGVETIAQLDNVFRPLSSFLTSWYPATMGTDTPVSAAATSEAAVAAITSTLAPVETETSATVTSVAPVSTATDIAAAGTMSASAFGQYSNSSMPATQVAASTGLLHPTGATGSSQPLYTASF